MRLPEIAIRRPVFSWMLMLGLIFFGALSFSRMGVSQLPDVDFSVISISVTLDGAAPVVMETDVVDPLEDAVMGVQGVRAVNSTSRNGAATISVEFELGKDIDVALQEIQAKVAQAQRHLPAQMEPPVITKTNPEDQPILWVALESSRHSMREMMSYVRDHLKGRISTVPGVGEVFLGGYIEPNLRVWVSEEKLARFALTVSDVIGTIRNEHSEIPGGRIETETRESNVRTMGEATSVQEFGDIVINSRGGQPNYRTIRLREVAEVEEGLADVRRISRTMGKPAVGMGIRKQRGSNAVAVARAVRQKIAELQKTLPEGMSLAINSDSTRFIEESVAELNFTLVLSAILTSLVCWLFLGSWSSTVNILLAIPTSIMGAFIVLHFMGFTLNTFTLLGLSLAIGIVVDDAIMVLENIVRHRERGLSRLQAALTGSREITFAALAATVAVVAIFLPVAFMKGIIGKFFYQFGVTITVAVLLSLLEALTLTPMRCSRFIDAAPRATRFGQGVEALLQFAARGYRRTLGWALRLRWLVVVVAIAFFAASILSVKHLNKEFIPAQDQSLFLVRFQTPVGSSIDFTSRKMEEVEKFLMSRPEVVRIFGSVGGFGGGEVNTGTVFVTLKAPAARGKNPKTGKNFTQQDIMAMCRRYFNALPGVKAFIQDLSMRGFTASRGFPVEFAVRGPEWEKLAEYSQRIKKELEASGLVTDVDSDYKEGMPEVQIVPDREKAALRGVSIATIGETVNALIGGVVVGRYPKEGHRYEIRVRLKAKERDKADQLRRLLVRNNRGELIRLDAVATIQEKVTLQAVSRKDRERAVTVFANIKQGRSQADALAQVQQLGRKLLPSGYHVTLSGSAETFKESFESLIFALLLGLVISYMVLASQFNSFIDPVTVLMALPFSLSGAFLALLLGGASLNIYSMIGLILLMGIVKKNSILLVDFTNQAMERRLSEGAPLLSGRETVHTALLEACPMRLRPILMTSIATIAGAVPPALAIGPGAESRIPMAIAVIGGVVVSTLLTLYVVPCVYSLFGRFKLQPENGAESARLGEGA
ncbi:MAG: efflux RND transporter permease subunit [Oligoflexia bacterium]|nr:efflux RND transporter permease subunit [Oligoflexia bacterium]